MKIRSLHPDFFTDSKITGLSFGARILFEGLWCRSDDYGRGRMLEKAIEGDVFPRDDVDISALLDELIQAGLIRSYQSGQDRYYFIPTWEKYQSPKYRAKSSIPEPPDETPSQTDPGQLGTNPGQSVQDFSPGEGEGEGVIEPNGSRPSRPPKGANPDELAIHAVFEDLFGIPADSDLGLRRRVAKSLIGVGATAGDVRQRAAAWPKLFDKRLTLSAPALEKWWGQLGMIVDPPAVDCENCDNRGVVWVDSNGARVPWDSLDAESAIKCQECAA